MTTQAELCKSNTDIVALYMVPILWKSVADVVTQTVLRAIQWQAIVAVHTSAILDRLGVENFVQLRKPEVIIKEEPWERVDVRHVEPPRLIEEAGAHKKNTHKGSDRKDSAHKGGPHKKEKSEAEKAAEKEEKKRQRREERRRREAEQERQRQWEDDWERMLDAKDKLDDTRCCLGEGLCLKPRTQSNIWINVNQDRTSQDIQMTFKHVPVPRPKPPPLPQLQPELSIAVVNIKPSTTSLKEIPTKEQEDKYGGGKKSGKKKK